MSEKETGTIKWFNYTKGFGFIERDKGGKDVFVHMTGLAEGTTPQDLTEGVKVEFEVEQSEKGPQAKNVRKI